MKYIPAKPWSFKMLPVIVAVLMPAWLAMHAEGTLLRNPLSLHQDGLIVNDPYVVVIKSRRMLYLFDGHRCVRTYRIDLGMESTGQKQHKADNRTPEGVFRVSGINDESQYGRFIGISYPDDAAALRGFSDGLLSRGDAQGIVSAVDRGNSPDGLTALGGGVGIHGGWRGEDWTAGCIAVSDKAVEDLYHVLRPGDVIEILP